MKPYGRPFIPLCKCILCSFNIGQESRSRDRRIRDRQDVRDADGLSEEETGACYCGDPFHDDDRECVLLEDELSWWHDYQSKKPTDRSPWAR